MSKHYGKEAIEFLGTLNSRTLKFYINPVSIESLGNFLNGYRAASFSVLNVRDSTKVLKAKQKATVNLGFEFLASGIEKQMAEKGFSEMEQILEIIRIEIEIYRLLTDA